MSREWITGEDAAGRVTRFLLDVFPEGEHFASVLTRLDDRGLPVDAPAAPRFYGATAQSARRRMLDLLDRQFEDLRCEAPPE